MGNSGSSFRGIKCGVAQGSVLGPTLFNLYVNDLSFLDLQSQLLIYADDFVLYAIGNDATSILNSMQADLNAIYRWSIENKLSVSSSETKVMLLGRPHKVTNLPPHADLNIGGNLLIG